MSDLGEPTLSFLKISCWFAVVFCASGVAGIDDAWSQQLTAEKLFASDRITDVQIEIPQDDWDKIRQQARTFAAALSRKRPESPFEYVRGNVTIDGVLIEDVGIRKKGFLGSLNAERPSLKIKFEEYVDQSPVEGLDRLTLNNNNQDPGRICQYLSYKLFRESGTFAPRCGFAKVTVNGKYLGIYSNVEPIKPDFLKFAFGDDGGALFEGTVTDFFPKWIDKFELKNDAADFAYLRTVADSLDSEDPEFGRLSELIDLDAFLKFWAMESLTGFWDGYCSNQNNYYVYRLPTNNKLYFIPWGTDSAFTDTSPIPPFRIRPRAVHAKAILPNRLYRNSKTKQAYIDTLMRFLEDHWDEETLIAEVDRLEAMLKDHLVEGNDGFVSTLNKHRRFIKGRRKAIMDEFKDGPPTLRSREMVPVYFNEIGSAEIEFTTQWFENKPRDVAGTGEVSVDITINEKKLVLKDLGVYAQQDERDANNASIVFIGKRESNGKQLIIGTGLPKSNFVPGDSPTSAAGILIEPGMLGMIGAKTRMMFGSVVLEKASMTPGDEVKGTMKLAIGEFKTGEYSKE